MNLQKSFRFLVLAVAVATAVPSHAAVLFSDNFDGDAATSVLNFSGLVNWTVSNGTIDYIKSGDYGISCVGGTGGCLDMDGSTQNAGRITSKATFSMVPGTSYVLEADVSGRQRGFLQPPTYPLTDDLTWGFIDDATSTVIASTTQSNIPYSDPFTLRSLTFTPASALSVRLFFEAAGGDNVGVILDNVVLRSVPEPATLGLLGLSLVGLAIHRRRSR